MLLKPTQSSVAGQKAGSAARVRLTRTRPRTRLFLRRLSAQRNLLNVHLPSGIPVDFFATDARSWFNYLVCRTGGAISNTRIATAALEKGWSWHPYRSGFTDHTGQFVPVHSEQDVFRLAGLPYLEPWDRS